MCELFGISARQEAQLTRWLSSFWARAGENPHGWGAGWHAEGRAFLMKEPLRADRSSIAADLASDPPATTIFIGHLRDATIGELTQSNTHPFVGMAAGQQWIFAHNGTIHNLNRLECGLRAPSGDTDSERAFHYLLHLIDDSIDMSSAIVAGARELSADGRANFLLSNGEEIFVYHDGHKTLHMLSEVDSTIFATVPLDDGNWIKLDPGTLLRCVDGRAETLEAPTGLHA